jgi:hypothetical protein
MNTLPPLLAALQASWFPPGIAGPVSGASAPKADALVRAINRKARFAQMHMAVLTAIDWSELHDIGRQTVSGGNTRQVHVQLQDASITISHPTAVIDHAYLAFDGLTAAVVNVTDTLGRMFNEVYGLGLDPRRASLFAVNTERCVATSALGTILNDPLHTDWLRRVRDLRGRCQHDDVDGVLLNPGGPLSIRNPPIIDTAYSWSTPPQPTLITDYAQQACTACEACMTAVINAVLSNPASPMT